MPAIYTTRNYVMVGKALPGDRYVATFIHPPHERRFLLTMEPIERLPSAIRWAMDMADYMVGPIEVLPMQSDADEYFRQLAVAIGFEGVAQTEPDIQRQGRELLLQLGIVV